jgi:hypothetical protein
MPARVRKGASVRTSRLLPSPGPSRRTISPGVERWTPRLGRGMTRTAPKRAAPRLCPNALPLQTTTLGDRVREILLFCRSAARHTVRPAGRFPLAGRGGASA